MSATQLSPENPATDRPTSVVRTEDLTKRYGSDETQVVALDSVTVSVARGEFTAIMGPSGSGKSTLMHCLAGLDKATSGRVYIENVELSGLSDNALTRLRRDELGFVFQSFNLLPTLSAMENITLPLDIAGRKPDQDWLDQIIAALHLTDRLAHRPGELSGGQQQRVAIARALVGRPVVVFADEPTGNLDSASGTEVLDLLSRSVHELGQTVVMVTHDSHAASYAQRVLFLADGRIVDDLDGAGTTAIGQRLDQLAAKETA
jgi:putative ABC transport system ATP-binding protein